MIEVGSLLPVIFWGIYTGCVYILLATGLNLIFGVMKVVNFAHGEVMMIGCYICYWIWVLSGVNPYLAIIPAMITMFFIGILIERATFRAILGVGKLSEIFISLGIIYVLQNVAALLWTSEIKKIISPYEKIIDSFFGASLPRDYTITILVMIAALTMLYLLLWKTRIGMAIRATSQNRDAAMLMGVDVEKIDMISFGLGSALAAVAGGLFALQRMFDPYIGAVPAIKAFAVIILGGLGSIPGAIVGGLLYGLAEALGEHFFGNPWRDATGFAILIIGLILRPEGLFGEKEA